MTATLLRGDAKGRYQLRSLLPKRTPYVSAIRNDDGTVTLTPVAQVAPATPPKPRLVRRKGRLVFVGGRPLTMEDVKAAQEDEP